MKFTIDEPVFSSGCTFLVNEPFEEVKKTLMKFADPSWISDRRNEWNDHAKDYGITYRFPKKNGYLMYVVWVRPKLAKVEELTTLVHELLHLTIAIAKDKAVDISWQNDETLARLQEFYFMRCLQYLIGDKKI